MITERQWRQLKAGDVVWVFSSWMKFAFPGVVKIRGGKKCVHINFFGDAQAEWRPQNHKRMLQEIYMTQEEAKKHNGDD